MALPEAVVLFGASGFVGRNIVDAVQHHVPVVVAVNRSGAPVAGCTHTVSAADIDAIVPLPADTVIVNVAAFRYAASSYARDQAAILETNLEITALVYRLALGRGISEVRNASSVAVYPASWAVLDDTRALDLNGPPHAGEAPYAWSKRWGEITAGIWHERHGISTLNLRLTNPYGPYDGQDEAEVHVATAFILRALGRASEFDIRGDPDAERDFVFAGDVAAAFLASLELRGVHDAMNLAAGRTTTVRGLAEAAMQAAGTVRPIRLATPPPYGGVKIRRATGQRLRDVLPGLAPFRSIDAGMAATLDWYRHAVS